MRCLVLIISAFLLVGCATGKPSEEDYQTRVGVIAGKEVVELEDGGGKRRVNTSVSASVSSGSGVSIGLGVLLGSGSRGAVERPPVGYRVDLLEGEQIKVFHESDGFEVGDCVEIRSLPDDESSPVQMKRVKDGC